MREIDSLRLESPPVYSAYEIKRLRLREKASQAVFAAHLNTSVSTVQKWEIGDKKPSGPANCNLAKRYLLLSREWHLAPVRIDRPIARA